MNSFNFFQIQYHSVSTIFLGPQEDIWNKITWFTTTRNKYTSLEESLYLWFYMDFSSLEKHTSFGGLLCFGIEEKGISKPSIAPIITGSLVSSFQIDLNAFSLPALKFSFLNLFLIRVLLTKVLYLSLIPTSSWQSVLFDGRVVTASCSVFCMAWTSVAAVSLCRNSSDSPVPGAFLSFLAGCIWPQTVWNLSF